MVSYAVSQRRSEIGVRLALGADQSRVRRMVLGEVLRMATVGIAAGLALTLSLGGIVVSFLFGFGTSLLIYVVLWVVMPREEDMPRRLEGGHPYE